MKTNLRYVMSSLTVATMLLGMAAHAEKKAIYNPEADARADIAAAVKKAAEENKHVLVQWGANWCGWCHLLHAFFEENKDVKAVLDAGYVLVLVDTDANKALLEEMKVKPRGIPYLTVLDAKGRKLTDQDTGSLETGPRHDPAKVLPFLTKWQPAKSADAGAGNAEALLKAARTKAASEEKSLFVSVGAEWCGWCTRLDSLLANDTVRPILDKHFVLLKLDQEKIDGTVAFREANAAKGSGGIPWYVTMDAKGAVLGTSDAKDGNTGYPARADEITQFIEVIKASAPTMAPADLNTLEAEVRRLGKAITGE